MAASTSLYRNNSSTYIVDTAGNRVEEIPATTGTQWGQAMNAGDIYTIAGSDTGGSGASGNGTPASGSLLNHPGGISIDGAGNLYIADTGNDRVLEIPAASGSQRGQAMTANDVYVIAGRTGQAGVGADGQPATSSDLNAPQAVTTGFGTQDLYIADTGNNRIQEIPAASGSQWGQPMTGNDIYTIAGSAAGTPGGSGDGGPAASALLDAPQGLNISSAGDLYIADTGNDRVQQVAAATGTQWAIAMTAFDIYTVAGRTGQADPGLDGKPATQSDLNQPTSVDCTNGQNLYIADNGNNRIQEVSRASDTEWGQPMTANDVYTIAGHQDGAAGYAGNGGLATSALLDQPEGIVVGGNFQTGNYTLFIADAANNEIRAVASTTADISDDAGGVGSFAQDGDGGPATTAGLLSPGGVASDAHGDIFVADAGANRVQEIAAYTHTQFGIPMTAGDTYTVAGQQGGYSGTGGDGGPATSAYLALPASVAADAAGNLYIADTSNNRIQEVSAASGTITTIAGSAAGAAGDSGQGGPATSALLDLPFAVAVDGAGDVFIAGNQTNQVYEVPAATGNGMTAGNIYTLAGSTAGTADSTGGGGPATSALLNAPQGITVDPAGNLYIADAATTGSRRSPPPAIRSGAGSSPPATSTPSLAAPAARATPVTAAQPKTPCSPHPASSPSTPPATSTSPTLATTASA